MVTEDIIRGSTDIVTLDSLMAQAATERSCPIIQGSSYLGMALHYTEEALRSGSPDVSAMVKLHFEAHSKVVQFSNGL